jgi:hypothetical protein
MRTMPRKRFLCSTAMALFLSMAAFSAHPAHAQTLACEPPTVVETPPPPLPDYDQPAVPGPGYIWTPGSWSWNADENDYYWVPGTWVQPPRAGLLWTPGYWSWAGGSYLFHQGYWGDHVGFYGGISYGHGYTGNGYEGGRWQNGTFFYNRAVTNVTRANITNVYDKTVIENKTVNNVSFNGGKGGVDARPTDEQRAFGKEQHFAPTALQVQHHEAASKDPALFEKTNHGKPAVAATARPGAFQGPDVTPVRDEEQKPGSPATGGNGMSGEHSPANEHSPEGNKPAVEQKRPDSFENGGKPATREMKPATDQAIPGTGRPAGEERKSIVEEKKPGVEQKKPGVDERTPDHNAKPEAMPHQARPEAVPPQARPPQAVNPESAARPERPAPGPAGHADPHGPNEHPHPGPAPKKDEKRDDK